MLDERDHSSVRLGKASWAARCAGHSSLGCPHRLYHSKGLCHVFLPLGFISEHQISSVSLMFLHMESGIVRKILLDITTDYHKYTGISIKDVIDYSKIKM